MKATIVGSGYVGLVTGTCFSEVGIEGRIGKLSVGELKVFQVGVSAHFFQEIIAYLMAESTRTGVYEYRYLTFNQIKYFSDCFIINMLNNLDLKEVIA